MKQKKLLNKSNIKNFFYKLFYGYRLVFPVSVEKTVVVLSMHRSGSSLTANILEELGVNMGRSQMLPDETGQKGGFENKFIKNLNKDIIRSAGGKWFNPPLEKEILKQKEKFKSKIKRTLRMEAYPVWGFKDPRTCLTLPLFLPYLKNPIFIICRRDINEVADSLKKRNNLPKEKGLKIAKTYNKRIDKFLSENNNFPVLEINFKDYFAKPEETVNKIADFLDVKLSLRQKEKCLKIINPKLVSFNSKI